MPNRGKFLRLFIGNMASGKTRQLLTEVDTLRKYGNRRVVVFKPKVDTRSGTALIKSRTGSQDQAVEISSPTEVWDAMRNLELTQGARINVVAFDEVQFFSRESGLFGVVERLLSNGYDVLAAGLALDFRGEPFGSTSDLALLAEDRCVWLTSYCTLCGSRATLPQRLIANLPAPYDSQQIQVGGDETYEPRCHEHFVLPRTNCSTISLNGDESAQAFD